ncbi:MAG: CDP-2,3-bis-(O-geranylgeranyl)-sn-glycerol synthase [Halobacteriota archaeon]|nr:CDP-2,3-bis-(O-geranylgeranyl)-sn-glycerol synthase [Halobacteriota archaeon]
MVTLNTIIYVISAAFWLMIPAYLPNSAAALIKGELPLDFKKNFIDGRRILGDGKTYRGFIGGTLCGFIIGLIQMISVETYNPFGMPHLEVIGILCLSFGAMFGDSAASFIKRRLGLKRGDMFPVVDQLDFVFGAWFICLIFTREWFLSVFTLDIIIATIVITPIIHIGVNRIAYKMGKKDVPW